jgi:hypothetical protein
MSPAAEDARTMAMARAGARIKMDKPRDRAVGRQRTSELPALSMMVDGHDRAELAVTISEGAKLVGVTYQAGNRSRMARLGVPDVDRAGRLARLTDGVGATGQPIAVHRGWPSVGMAGAGARTMGQDDVSEFSVDAHRFVSFRLVPRDYSPSASS